MNSSKVLFALKHVVYSVLILILYALQTTPGLFVVGGVTPILVIPAALTIAMLEGEFVGGIYGALAGLLIDVNGVALFGYNGFIICASCVGAGLLVIYLLRCNLLGCLLFVSVTVLVRGSIEYLFAYGMWGHENIWKLYVTVVLPAAFYTVVATPLVYGLVRWIFRKFDAAMTR